MLQYKLSHTTIPNKNPIPEVDELLDELFGAIVFKIDLKSNYFCLCLLVGTMLPLLFYL